MYIHIYVYVCIEFSLMADYTFTYLVKLNVKLRKLNALLCVKLLPSVSQLMCFSLSFTHALYVSLSCFEVCSLRIP